MLRLAIPVASAVLVLSGSAVAQESNGIRAADGCSPSSSDFLSITEKLRAANADDASFLRALDKSIGIETALFLDTRDASPGAVVDGKDLSVTLMPPYMAYKVFVAEAVRRREPLNVRPSEGVVVSVAPLQINAPDIIKIVLDRNGTEIPAIRNDLKPTPMSTRIGATRVVHSGTIVFPCAAFLPDAKVTITAIPDVGDNIVRTFSATELVLISARRERMASTLMGASAAAVEEQLGKPSSIVGHLWRYSTQTGSLEVFFDDAPKVVDVRPPAFDVGSIRSR